MTQIEFLKICQEFLETKGSKQCWEWPKARDKDGYGLVAMGYYGKLQRVHRLVLKLLGDMHFTRKDYICHKCDNSPCFNPRHLFIGDAQINMDDMIKKGLSPKGSKHPRTKLTEDDVRTIRQLAKNGMRNKDIAKQYDINPSVVSSIKARITWKHI